MLREEQGLTLEQVGEPVDLNARGWQKVEAGVHSPTLETLVRVALALDVDLIDLLG